MQKAAGTGFAFVILSSVLPFLTGPARAQDMVAYQGRPALRYTFNDAITYVSYLTRGGESAFCFPILLDGPGLLYVSRARLVYERSEHETVFDHPRSEVSEVKPHGRRRGADAPDTAWQIRVATRGKNYDFWFRLHLGTRALGAIPAALEEEFFRVYNDYDLAEREFRARAQALGLLPAPAARQVAQAVGAAPLPAPAPAGPPAVKVLSVEAQPPRLRAGEAVRLVAQIELSGVAAGSKVAVGEDRRIQRGWEIVFSTATPVIENRVNGRHESVFEFAVPASSAAGVYEYELSVHAAGSQGTRRVVFEVLP